MKGLFWCLFLGALAGGGVLGPTLARAMEPVWLTEEQMDKVTAGTAVDLDVLLTAAMLESTIANALAGATTGTSASVNTSASVSTRASISTATLLTCNGPVCTSTGSIVAK